MASKRTKAEAPVGKVIERSLEEVMHQSMMPYAEYVILERALPRVEDGLKPVQRRILYAMMELGNTPDKPFRKCARIVGDTMGKYHPHGDTSIYDALVRMAQPFNMSLPLIEGHGNFGSADGDSAAAMRYTEARLAPPAMELLRDIEKDTVEFTLNFDDSLKEPRVLPGRFPNLLVNGAEGIAVGLSTKIPPHNLGEAIDGAIAMLKKPNLSLDELMEHIKGPDFPTGGYCTAGAQLRQAYETGRGIVQLRAKTEIEREKNGKSRIVITELPYQVKKADNRESTGLLTKILKLCEEKKGIFLGIADIRDESDKQGIRAVIELKKDADPQKILHSLFRYTDLQVSFGINMVAIVQGKPMQLGLLELVRHYVEYQREVLTRRSNYELFEAERREHIVAGLILACLNIDEVIRIIRRSENAAQARTRLMQQFELTGEQAQAILDMRLRRLTSLEVLELQREQEQLRQTIERLRGILEDPKKLTRLLISELKEIRQRYDTPRRTALVESLEVARVEIEQKRPNEPCEVVWAEKGYLKRLSAQKAARSADEAYDENASVIHAMTEGSLQLFTNRGNMYTLAVSQLPQARLKERGAAVTSLLAGLEHGERVIAVLPAEQLETGSLVLVTRGGLCKRVQASAYATNRAKLVATGLREGDELLAVWPDNGRPVAILTRAGMSIRFLQEEMPEQGRTAAGVRGIALTEHDEVIYAGQPEDEAFLLLVTDRGDAKKTPALDFELQRRGGKGQKAYPFGKAAQGGQLAAAMELRAGDSVAICQQNGAVTAIGSDEIPAGGRQSAGAAVVLALFEDVVVKAYRRLQSE